MLLYDRFPALRDTLPRIELGQGPTPVRSVEGFWVKDESAYGRVGGGNKARKLEWTLADARRQGRRTIVTTGAIATNHGLATAVYAREQGLKTVLLLADQPEDDHVRAQLARIEATGADIHRTHGMARTMAGVPFALARHRPAYFLPPGGSSPLGAVGYVEAALELAEQVRAGELPEPAWTVVALGSGGTAAGLALGLRLAGLRTNVLAVSVYARWFPGAIGVSALARATARLLRHRGAAVPGGLAEVEVDHDSLGAGYGHHTEEAERALERAAGTGLHLEPVYTAKALAALLRRDLPGPVLFWQTYGPPVSPE